MRDFPSCLWENGVQVGDALSCSTSLSVGMNMMNKSHQNSTTCIYKCIMLDKMSLISLVWGKTLMGQTLLTLTIEIEDIDDDHICKLDVKPSLFSRKKGSKCLDLNSRKIEVFWDFSTAKFGAGQGLEPLEGYYIGLVCEGVMVLLIGDLTKDAFKRSGAIASFSSSGSLISKREHIFGKRVFCSKAQFYGHGRAYNIEIEHNDDGGDDLTLVIRVDLKTVMRVRHLRWKFRGIDSFWIDGLPVELCWDVHNWLFAPSLGSGIFMFRAGLLNDASLSLCSSSSEPAGLGFSLFLYAWKNGRMEE